VTGVRPLHEIDDATEVVTDFPDLALTHWLVQLRGQDHDFVADPAVIDASLRGGTRRCTSGRRWEGPPL
jgi:hypothetical protein